MKVQYIGFLPAIFIVLFVMIRFIKQYRVYMKMQNKDVTVAFDPFTLIVGIIIIITLVTIGLLWGFSR